MDFHEIASHAQSHAVELLKKTGDVRWLDVRHDDHEVDLCHVSYPCDCLRSPMASLCVADLGEGFRPPPFPSRGSQKANAVEVLDFEVHRDLAELAADVADR